MQNVDEALGLAAKALKEAGLEEKVDMGLMGDHGHVAFGNMSVTK